MTAGKSSKQTASSGVSKELEEKLTAYARKDILKTFEGSSIEDKVDEYPTFLLSELTLGKVLGKGGFGTVSEVRAFKTVKEDKNEDTPEGKEEAAMESRAFIAQHCLRSGTGDARYAIKVLSPETVSDGGMFCQGMIDMAIETRVLSSIEHPNIMKMRAVANCEPFDAKYFIVMDRLYDTLEARLKKWESTKNRLNGMGGLMDRNGSKRLALYEERIVKAFDLCSAFEYLHKKNILYRDIKPENIGFDIRDDIKVFDFGLAKELRDDLKNKDDPTGTTYKLTEMTGSPRYMAPEVANAQPYNATCDVYSFAILLWQMIVLKTPYELYTPKSLREKVYNGPHKRPVVEGKEWPSMVRLCLKRSWDADISQRSSMEQVAGILRKECVRVRNGNESGLDHYQRRSTFVFRANKVM